ncbi:MAG: hypothetical protein EB072_21425, partial [Betaproteobacteria bacterium]|nr:hypothetical protein [Betaproteobacteria bacterium]
GDGLADLIVGANESDPLGRSLAGRSYVIFGKTTNAAIELSAIAAGSGGFVINGQCSGDQSGGSVASAGDVNGDGLADLIVGADWSDPSGMADAGRSYVIFGNTVNAFSQTQVDWLGGSGNDVQSDGGIIKTLVAGAGNDQLTATAASVLYGGAGNDRFTINSAMITALQNKMGSGGNVSKLARIDGGSGIDTLALDAAGLSLDLTLVSQSSAGNPLGGDRVSSIEVIDLTGSGNNTLKLNASDVLALGSVNAFETTGRHQLVITGNSGDIVKLATGSWTSGGTLTLAGYTGTFDRWNTDSQSTVFIAHGLTSTVNKAPTGTLTITGTPYQGQTLSLNSTVQDADGLGTISYQWLANGQPISGANQSTLTLTQAQVGQT